MQTGQPGDRACGDHQQNTRANLMQLRARLAPAASCGAVHPPQTPADHVARLAALTCSVVPQSDASTQRHRHAQAQEVGAFVLRPPVSELLLTG